VNAPHLASTSPVACVVLAAGASRRLGQPKQLLQLNGESLLRRTARLAHAGGFRPVLVVCGHERERMRTELSGLDVAVVANDAWSEGMSGSIRVGLAAVPEVCTGALLLASDQPALDAILLEHLRAAHLEHPAPVIACAYSDLLGIPALFPRALFAELLGLQGDRGAGAWLRAHRDEVHALPFPEGALDLDTPDDVARWRERS
jgi:molybdenum cofactor cytidylyltransferase